MYIVSHSGFSRCISFAMYLDIIVKSVSKKTKTTYNLEWREYYYTILIVTTDIDNMAPNLCSSFMFAK